MSTTKKMDSFTACSIIEGFSGEDHSALEELQAWAYLIETGQAWSLQGFYGRGAASLIEQGYVTKAGKITPAGREAIQ